MGDDSFQVTGEKFEMEITNDEKFKNGTFAPSAAYLPSW